MKALPKDALGKEQHEYFTDPKHNGKEMCQYDYRHTDGDLFSCIKINRNECHKARDQWLLDQGKQRLETIKKFMLCTVEEIPVVTGMSFATADYKTANHHLLGEWSTYDTEFEALELLHDLKKDPENEDMVFTIIPIFKTIRFNLK